MSSVRQHPPALASVATAVASTHQLVLRARLTDTDELVALHGDIGESDGALLHPQALELRVAGGRQAGAGGGQRGAAWPVVRAQSCPTTRIHRTPPPRGVCGSLRQPQRRLLGDRAPPASPGPIKRGLHSR